MNSWRDAWRGRLSFPVICGLMLVGCTQSEYPLAPVSGMVKLDGQPLADAVVNFQPMATEGNNAGPGSTGRTDASGRFELTTMDDLNGAVVGKHKVRIYSYSPESPSVSDEDDANTPVEKVPDQYNYRSRLEFEVPSAGTQAADFDLQS